MVRYTKPEATDDPGYLDWVEATVVGVEEAIQDEADLRGKDRQLVREAMAWLFGQGARCLGVRKKKLTLPPFIPHAWCLSVASSKAILRPDLEKRLHVWQRSGENLQRYTEIILQGSNAF